MNCKQGDMAFIKMSVRIRNLGLIVTCKENLGYYLQDDIVEINGERWVAPISGDYWLIESPTASIETMFGKAREAYIPDAWLSPLPTDGVDGEDEIIKSLDELATEEGS